MTRPAQHPAATSDARKRAADAEPVSAAMWAEVIREARAEALREAADAFEHDYAATWGGPAAWLTTGDSVGRLVAEILRELAEEVE